MTPRAQHWRHFQELKSAPPRAIGFAYACSATKALAGDGPIAVPHTAAQDEWEQPLPPDAAEAPLLPWQAAGVSAHAALAPAWHEEHERHHAVLTSPCMGAA